MQNAAQTVTQALDRTGDPGTEAAMLPAETPNCIIKRLPIT